MKLRRNIFGVPVHPLIVPFPLVLWLTSPVFAAVALWLGPQPWWGLSLGASTTGVVIGVVGIATGLLEFLHRTKVDVDVRLSARHGIRTSLAWLLFTGKLIMAALLPTSATTISIALAVDLVACAILLQGVILGVRLIYSEDVRDRQY